MIRQDVRNYAAQVVRVEWGAMAEGRIDPKSVGELRKLTLDVADADTAAPAVQGELLALMSAAHLARETRTFQMQQGLPAVIWGMLSVLYLTLAALLILAGLDTRGHALLVGAFTGSIMLVLTLVSLLDYPFAGSFALSNADFFKLLT